MGRGPAKDDPKTESIVSLSFCFRDVHQNKKRLTYSFFFKKKGDADGMTLTWDLCRTGIQIKLDKWPTFAAFVMTLKKTLSCVYILRYRVYKISKQVIL